MCVYLCVCVCIYVCVRASVRTCVRAWYGQYQLVRLGIDSVRARAPTRSTSICLVKNGLASFFGSCHLLFLTANDTNDFTH